MGIYQQGYIGVTNGSTAVTGDGTYFKNYVKPGDILSTDAESVNLYEISTVNDNDSLTLTTSWGQSTDEKTSYIIATADIVEGLSDVALLVSANVDALASQTRARFLTLTPGQELPYVDKLQNAKAYAADGYPMPATDYRWIAAEAAATGQTPTQVANAIIDSAIIWIKAGADIEAARQNAKLDIAAASTIEAIYVIYDAFVAAMAALVEVAYDATGYIDITPTLTDAKLDAINAAIAWGNHAAAGYLTSSHYAADNHTQYALLAGRTGGQSIIGGTASGNNLTLNSTSHATKGRINLGSLSYYDEATQNLTINKAIVANNAYSATKVLLSGLDVDPGGYAGLWFGTTTASATNYTFLNSPSLGQVFLNGTRVADDTLFQFRSGNGQCYLSISRFGIGLGLPANTIGAPGIDIAGGGPLSFLMRRHTTSNTAGNNLTVQSGGATVGATDKNGGTLALSGGIATGTGYSGVQIKTAQAGATGTADRTPATIIEALGNKLAFNGATPITKPTVTGSRGGNAALASLITALATLGLITDSTTA